MNFPPRTRHRSILWGVIGVALLLSGTAMAQGPNSFPPFNPPPQPRNTVPLSPSEQLGKDIFFDHTLSAPVGYSCATCHIPKTGWTGPSSAVNAIAGPVPGVVRGRFGNRKPQAIAYSAFSPAGPYYDADISVFLGGNFWDGRAPDNATQARMPFINPDEMNNTATGPLPPHKGGYSVLVAEKLANRPYTPLFEDVFGHGVFEASSHAQIFELATEAIAAYEASAEVNPFNSKFDASKYATPPSNLYKFTRAEENGRKLYFGKAQCFQCHSSATLDPVLAVTDGRDSFTMYCYANIGVPRNQGNPFYYETDSHANPLGFNALGLHFIDYGLGANPNPGADGTRFMNQQPGDIPQFRGLFKAPSTRNVDKRPNDDFDKSYMHNGVFKSLREVVRFYNKRNIAVNSFGHRVAFDLRNGPPEGYRRLFGPPEVLDNVQNVEGLTPDNAGADVASNGQVGNLGLTDEEEEDVVAFLRTLSDGFVTQSKGSPSGPSETPGRRRPNPKPRRR